VTTRSSVEGWAPAEASVRRRFKDFVSLADVLKVNPTSAALCLAGMSVNVFFAEMAHLSSKPSQELS
jgi:hypothetical protein